MTLSYYFFLFFLLFSPLLAGHIYSLHPTLDFMNAGDCYQISMPILLETPLLADEYFYMKLPFKIGSNSWFSLSWGVLSTEIVKLNVVLNSDPIFSIQTLIALPAYVWYNITAYIDDMSFQTSGIQGCISLKTISSVVNNNGIIYDENPCLDVIALSPAIDSTGFSVKGSYASAASALKNTFGASYQAFFDITPHKVFLEGGQFQLMIAGGFQFDYPCLSIQCTAGATDCSIDIPIMNSSICVLDSTTNSLFFTISGPITKNLFRIAVNIINPNQYITTPQTITVYYQSVTMNLGYGVTTVTEASSNPLSLVTSYPTSLSIANTVKILWGLIPQADGSKDGCPMVLYSMANTASPIPIYNNLRSEFSVSNLINSFQANQYLAVLWYITSIKQANILPNSVISNLPASPDGLSWNVNNNYDIIQFFGINSLLTGTTYYISGRFSLNSAAAGSMSSDSGEIDVVTYVDGAFVNIVTDVGVNITIKENREYVDNAVSTSWFFSPSSKNFYNFMYSYKASDYNLQYNSVSNTVAQIKTTIDTAFFSTTSKIGIFVKPTGSQDIYNLFIILYAGQFKICKDGFLDTGVSKCSYPVGSANGLHILMKIIFNNNVLGIDSNNFGAGVLPVGSLFARFDGVNRGVSDFNVSSQGKQTNIISVGKDSSGNGIFHHVSMICLQPGGSTGTYNDFCHSIVRRNSSSVSGISFINTNIQVYPQLYMDDNVFDMIICFKAMKYATMNGLSIPPLESFFTLYEDSTNKGGPGILHGYVLSGGPPLNSFAYYANYYKDQTSSYGDGNYVASYLRVSVTFGTDLLAPGSYLAVFFSDGALSDLQFYADSTTSIINCLDMAASTPAITGKVLPSIDQSNSEDFWWEHKGILLNRAISSGNSYNFYIPMLISSSYLMSLNVAVMSSTYQVKALYKIIGSPYLAQLTLSFTSTNNNILFTSLTNYNADNTDGCAISGTIPILNPGTSSIKPYSTILNMAIKTDIASKGTGNYCKLQLNTSPNYGALFVVYSRSNVFSNSQVFTWDYAGTSINKCSYHAFGQSYYTILCTLDSGTNVPTISASNKNLAISSFAVPFYWGMNYAISSDLQYVWSQNNGLGVSMILDLTTTSTWIVSSCSVAAVTSIPINTQDIYYSIAIKNIVKYDLLAGDSIIITETLTSSTAAASINYISCLYSTTDLQCTYTATGVFTLTNSGTTGYSVIPGSITIYALIDSPSTFTATTHTAKISYNSVFIETCSETGFTMGGSQITNDIILSNFLYVSMQNARGAFQFTFTMNRNFRASNYFYFNWGFFASGFSNKAYECGVLESTGLKSHIWGDLDMSDPTSFKLKLMNDVYGGGSYILRCVGVQTSTLSSQTPISASYVRGTATSPVLITSSLLTIEKLGYTSIPSESILTGSSLIKNFINRGFDADYIFSFTPRSSDITIDGRIYIEFSLSIAPKLNPWGKINCYLNYIETYCEIIAERRVSVTPNTNLSTLISTPYVLILSGVRQPTDVDNNMQVYLALDNNTNPYDGISEHIYISEPADSTIVVKPLFLEEIVLSNTFLRNTVNIDIQVLIGSGGITSSSTQIFIQFPQSFEESLKLSSVLSCSMKRVGDTTSQELSISCFLIYGRKILMKASDTGNSVDSSYHILITNVITPQYPTPLKEDLQVFISNDNISIIASTFSCLRNTSQFLMFTTADNSTIQLDFFNTSLFSVQTVDVYQGSYRNMIGLGPTIGNFPSTFKWSFVNITNATFYVNPSQVAINVGSTASFFSLATDQNTIIGLYLITAIKTGVNANKYSTIPALNVRVRDEPCQLFTNQDIYIVPYGGRSVPIVIDFSSCIPIQQVIVIANVTVGYDLYYINIEGEKTMTKTLNFSQNSHKITFYAESYSHSALIGSPMAIINFTMYGPQGYAYLPPSPIQIQVIDSTKFQTAPTPLSISINTVVGMASIQAGCSQIGMLYYSIGLDNSTESYTYNDIQNLTENLQIQQTDLINKDQEFKIFGYMVINTEGVQVSIDVTNKLKAGGNYSIYAYCLNLANVPSTEPGYSTWTQPDNNGQRFRIGFIYNSKLSKTQKLDIACAFSAYFKLDPQRILTDENTYCQINNQNLLRLLQNASNSASNSSNSTNSSSNATSLSSNTSSSTSTIKYYPYYWFFTKNYTAATDDTYSLVATSMVSPSFYSDIMGLTTEGLSAFPLLNASSLDLMNVTNSSSNTSSIPSLISSMINAGSATISLNLTISNLDGYVYIGITPNASTPDADQLKQGVNGNGSAFAEWAYAYSPMGVAQPFDFTNLTNKTYYYLYYVASNNDPTDEGIMSNVVSRTVFTSICRLAVSMMIIGVMSLIYIDLI